MQLSVWNPNFTVSPTEKQNCLIRYHKEHFRYRFWLQTQLSSTTEIIKTVILLTSIWHAVAFSSRPAVLIPKLCWSPRFTNSQPSSSLIFSISCAVIQKGRFKKNNLEVLQNHLFWYFFKQNVILHLLSKRATSGLIDAVFIKGPMTTGRYCWNSFPRILHILAHAEIM